VLLEDLADDEEVNLAAGLAHKVAGFAGVVLRRGVEVALVVIPVDLVPAGKVAAHLQVERDGDERSVFFLGRGRHGKDLAASVTTPCVCRQIRGWRGSPGHRRWLPRT